MIRNQLIRSPHINTHTHTHTQTHTHRHRDTQTYRQLADNNRLLRYITSSQARNKSKLCRTQAARWLAVQARDIAARWWPPIQHAFQAKQCNCRRRLHLCRRSDRHRFPTVPLYSKQATFNQSSRLSRMFISIPIFSGDSSCFFLAEGGDTMLKLLRIRSCHNADNPKVMKMLNIE